MSEVPPDPRHLDDFTVGSMMDGFLRAIEKRKLPYKKVPIPWVLRARVLQRDDGACQMCGYQSPNGWSGSEMHADHIFPERLGGKATMENLQTLCKWCNSKKGARV